MICVLSRFCTFVLISNIYQIEIGTRDVSPNKSRSRRVLLLKDLICDSGRQHMAGDVPAEAERGNTETVITVRHAGTLICPISSVCCLDVICHGQSTRSTTTKGSHRQ
jgi:hypothetical protein